ncbi:MAG: 16S rRNA (adenine(1518)-N(6)/adenine(1519)-N(6))-dimethyltransferase RsmA [Thermoanaerobacteraceae bacterium]|nr:16S rRNA (adenine(1518)-N(6)/adenine(1519)-N(6))-dimethyltransferase RsmA [Thermoanaerobacteraceae bacterium]
MRVRGFDTKKSLGQNFIMDKNILAKIVDYSGVNLDDNVIEIGAGLGTLTVELAKRVKKVVTFEIDKEAVLKLNENVKGFNNIIIINKDIREVNLKDIINTYFEGNKCKVVANLPYYITSYIIMYLLQSQLIEEITILIQKEVADRICALPGSKEYGVLTIAVKYYAKPEILFSLPPEVFIPRPKVSSTLIKLNLLKNPSVSVKDEKLFFRIVKAAFGQRRKIISNSLNSIGLGKNIILEALRRCGINEKQRGETVSIEKFADLTNIIFDIMNM